MQLFQRSSFRVFPNNSSYISGIVYLMETTNTLENVFCMKGGNGDSSYAYHSPSVQVILSTSLICVASIWLFTSYSFTLVTDCPISSWQWCFLQLKMVQALQPLVEHGIYNNVRSNSMGGSGSVFRIADLGCATGINTLLVADTIVTAVKLTFIRHSVDVPEFQVFFADLPSNDFNTLFRTLPPLREDETTTELTAPAAHDQKKPPSTRSYFASAVSGSHYGRLFPRQTLNFCHSSTSLHWLSQVI